MKSAPQQDSAFLLHSRRYRENSQLLEVLSENHGRLALVARGVGGGRQRAADVLQPFRELALFFSGRTELLTLHKAEPLGAMPLLAGDRLISGLYINELIIRLTGRGETDDSLYPLYRQALGQLCSSEPLEPLLRRFEVGLLEHCGYGLALLQTTDDEPVRAGDAYVHVLDAGLFRASTAVAGMAISGEALLALAGQLPFSPLLLAETKHFMRGVLKHHLGGKPLHARELFTGGKS